MRLLKPGLLAAAVLLGLGHATPGGAVSGYPNMPPGWTPPARGAPGPLAGVGLPILLLIGAAGAYRAMRSRSHRREEDDADRR